jgi:hypothetical protein
VGRLRAFPPPPRGRHTARSDLNQASRSWSYEVGVCSVEISVQRKLHRHRSQIRIRRAVGRACSLALRPTYFGCMQCGSYLSALLWYLPSARKDKTTRCVPSPEVMDIAILAKPQPSYQASLFHDNWKKTTSSLRTTRAQMPGVPASPHCALSLPQFGLKSVRSYHMALQLPRTSKTSG